MTVRVRPMTTADAPAVAELATQLGYPARLEEIIERMARLADGSATAALLVVVDDADRLLAWAHVELRDTLVAPPAAQLMALVVAVGARSRGVGRDLLRAAEAWAAERGCDSVLVATRVTRGGAHRFYRREGYALTKTSHIFEKPVGSAVLEPQGPC